MVLMARVSRVKNQMVLMARVSRVKNQMVLTARYQLLMMMSEQRC
jgi:hypothetical protein